MLRRLWLLGFLALTALCLPAQQAMITQGEYFWDTDPGPGNGITFPASDGNLDEVVEGLQSGSIPLPSGNGAHTFNARVKDIYNTWSPVFTVVVYRSSNVSGLRSLHIAQAEYFWDTDPGQGNGAALLALDGNLDDALETLFQNGIPLPAGNGPHTFNVRVRDADNQWSPLYTTLVQRQSNTSNLRDIKVVQAEYFWDTDPGQGNASPILALDGNLDESVETLLGNSIGIPAAVGPHSFNLRVKDVDNQWSPLFSTIVMQDSNTTSTRTVQVSVAEYFWDVDPGQGNANLIIALDGNLDESVESLIGNNLILPASNGGHSFNIRVQDGDNQWSPLFTTLVWRDSITGNSRQMRIVEAEYFWDVDPGQGNANPLLALDGNLDETIETLFQNGIILPANNGPHTFNLRVKEVDNQWSPLFSTLVVRDSITALAGPHHVTQGEYYWNTDPGPGNGQPMLAVDGNFDQSLEQIFQIISPGGLPPGPNVLYIRVKGSDGVWGPVFGSVVSTSSPVFNADSLGGPKNFCGQVPPSAVTYFADTTGGSTYTWFVQNGSILSGQGTDTISVQWAASGPYQVSLEGCNAQTCDTLFLDVIVNPLPTVEAGANDSICPGLGSQLNASTTTPPVTWDWTPAAGLSATNIPNPVANPSLSTTYSLTVTDTNGCQSTDSVYIHVFPAAIANAGPDSLICIGDSLQLNGSGGISYAWTPTASLSDPNIATPIATPTSSTTYSLTVVDANSCTDNDQVTITVSNGPNVNAGSDQTICIGDGVQLNATGASTYLWVPASGLSNPNIANPFAAPTATVTYTVTGTDGNGCQNSDQITVTVAPLPTVTLSPDTAICIGQSVQLLANGGTSYQWSPTAGLNNPNSRTPIASPTATTVYTVNVTDGNNCQSSDSLTLTVHPLPLANAGLDTTICGGDSIQLLATGGQSYLWTPGSTLSDSSINNPYAKPIFTTTYTVLVTDSNSCQASDTVRIEVEICDSNTVNRRVTQAEYFWDTDPGQGNGTPLLAEDGLFDETIETVLRNGIQMPVTTGPHSFNVRVKGTDGAWGPLFTTLVERLPLTGIHRDMAVIQAEYFWDTDPGQGNGSVVLALDGNLDETVETLLNNGISLPGSNGPHTFNVRVKDIDNQWGPIFSTLVQKQDLTTGTRPIQVSLAEYFWDIDPGQGSATPMLAFDGNFDETLETLFEDSIPMIMTPGAHTFNVRVQDADNQWSSLFSTVVYCDSLNTLLRNVGITQAEYFWDIDPGQGNGTPLLALDGNIDDVVESLLRNSIGLPASNGAHVFHVRVKDPDNQWSPVFQTLVYRDTITTVVRDHKVVQAEYFWNTDPGQGNGLPLLALDGNIDDAVEALIQSPINLPTPQGAHRFNVRVKDVDNQWSTVFTTLVWRDSITVGTRDIKVVMAEYFWDTDPGQGNGLPLLALDGNIDDAVESLINSPINLPPLNGPHTFNVRVKDVDNQWSSIFTTLVHRDSITVGTRPMYVTMAEYFWNTDPGQGNGQPILAVDGNFDETLEKVAAQINVTTLPPGLNLFNVRVKGADNVWGPVFTTVIDIDSNLFVGPDTIYGPNEFCGQIPAQPIIYTTDTVGTYTYNWFVTGGTILSGQGSDSVRVQWNPAGPYSVSVETCDPFSFCDTLVQPVVVHPLPTATAGPDTSICPGQTVQLIASGGVAYLWTPSAGLNDDDIPNPFATPTTTTQYIVTVFDANGCSDNDTVLVTVLPPAAANAGPDQTICPGDTAQLNGSGGLTFAWTPTGSLSNPNIPNPQAFPTVTTTYTLTVQNAQGCFGSDTATVFIDDSAPTIVCPANLSVNNDSSFCSAVVNFTPPLGTDNCPGASTVQTAGLPSGVTFPVGVTLQTYRVTNAIGKQDSCSFTITVIDAELPQIACPSDTTISNDSSLCSAVLTYTLPIASDNCHGFSISQTNGLPSGSAFAVGQTTNTYRVTDASGNQATCTFTVTVLDTEAPSIACPINFVQNSDPGQCGATVTYIQPIGTDNCPGATTVQIAGIGRGGFFPLGTTPEVYQVTDAAGNIDTCTFTITVIDAEAPLITCPANIVLTNDSAQCGAIATYAAPTATDNCPGPFVTQLSGLGSGNLFPVGINTETYIASDSAGNQDTCSFTIQVIDNEAPSILCPLNIVAAGDTSSCGAIVNYVAPIGTDNCPNPTTSLIQGLPSGSLFPVGTTLVRYEVTDTSGNTANCAFIVEVQDTIAPTLICPAPITVNAGSGNCDQQVFYNVTAFDNCPGDSLVRTGGLGSGAIFPVGITIETYTLYDANGNTDSCAFAVTVQDTQAPVITCPPDLTRNVDPGQCGANVLYGTPSATDNCLSSSITQISGQPTGSFFPVGTTANVYVASDTSGNTDSCTVLITVIDSEAPVIICPTNITVNASASNCNSIVTYTPPVGTDNCPGVSTQLNQGLGSGATFPAGTTLEIYIATDAAGNTDTCSFTITVVDSILPSITCPANQQVSNDAGRCDAVVNYTPPLGTDNCPGAITSQISGFGPGQIFPVGTTLVAYSVTDATGNADTCSFTVTVNDTENPVITCPANLIVGNDPGRCDAFVTYILPTGTDNCPAANTARIAGIGPNSIFPLGSTTETYEVTDASGNTALCSFTVTVEDREAPVITCPADTTLPADPVSCSALFSYAAPTATDNCSNVSILLTGGLGSGSQFPVGSNLETYTATDTAGNTSTCSFTITVVDNQAPVITCPANINVNTDPNNCDAVVNYTPPVGTDNCPGTSTQLIAGLPTGATFPVGTTLVQYEASDASGNRDTCSFTVNVTDNIAPQITCPASQILANDLGQCGAIATWANPTVLDNCPGVNISLSGQANNSQFPVGTTVQTYIATDPGGNQDSCSFTITVNDVEAPQIACPANDTLANDPGQCSAVYTYTAPLGTDNCPGASTSLTAGLGSGAAFPVGTTLETYTVIDAAGNRDSCTFSVLVLDLELPQIACPADTIISVQGANCDAQVIYPIPTYGDNCPGASLNLIAGLPPGATFPLGSTTVAYEASDLAGNRDSCSFNVTVIDSILPSISCPADIVVSNDSSLCSAVVTYTPPVGTDNCPGASTSLFSGLGSGSAFPVGISVETYVVSDGGGNSDTCSFNITVLDSEAPRITCPADTTINSDFGFCSAVFSYTPPVGTDNCPGAFTTLISGLAPGSTFPVGINGITYQTTDLSGNVDSCSFTLTVIDNEAPSIVCPANIVVNNDSGLCAALVNYPAPTGADNCVQVSTTLLSGQGSNTLFAVGTHLETYMVSDSSGNSDTCSFSITVLDGEAPQITCPANITVNTDPGQCSAIVNYTPPLGLDNCPGAITQLTQGLGNGASFPLGTTTVAYQVTDGAGHIDTCSFLVTVNDAEAPVLTCPVDTIVGNAQDTCGTFVNYTLPTATDNCPGVVVQLLSGRGSGAYFDGDTLFVETYVAIDASGNRDTCSFTIQLAACNAAPIALDDTFSRCNTPQAILYDVLANDTDPDGDSLSITLLSGPSNGSAFITTNQEISYIPNPGFSGNDTLIYSVCDDGSPVLCDTARLIIEIYPTPVLQFTTVDESCPGNSDGSINLTVTGGTAPYTYLWSTTDTTEDISGLSPGTYTVTVTSADLCEVIDSVTIQLAPDTLPPIIVCPQDTLIYLDSTSCSMLLPDYTLGPGATLANAAQDFSGIQGQNGWQYGFYPAFQPQNFTQFSPANYGPIWFGTEAFATPFLDPNGGHPGVNTFAWAVRRWTSNYNGQVTLSGDFFDRDLNCGDGANVRIFVDGNQVYDFQSIPGTSTPYSLTLNVSTGTVIDFAIDPRFDTGCDDTHFSSVIQTVNGTLITDNCALSTVSSTPPAGTLLGPGVTQVTLTALDSAGNSSTCDFEITLADTLPPIWNCPTDRVVSTDSGLCGATVTFPLPTASDNCGAASISSSNFYTSGSFFPAGVHTLNYTATDTFGNSSQCSFTITVVDSMPPVMFCPTNLTVSTDPGQCSAVVNYTTGFSDNCIFVSRQQTAGLPPGSAFPLGTTLNSFRVTDPSGNQDSCSFTITVNDSLPPVLNCPANIVVSTDSGLCAAIVNYPAVSISENCAGGQFSQVQGLGSGALFPVGSTTEIYQASDSVGNVDSCIFTITVVDSLLPRITCPADTIVTADSSNCSAVVIYQVPLATDNCPGVTTLQTSGLGSGATFSAGLSIETYLATDASGNVDSCSFTITVVDSAPPVLLCTPDIIVNADSGSCTAVVTYTPPSAVDNCSSGALNPVTSLSLGDIAFTSYRSDNPDEFSFVTFKDLDIGTQISFTDRGWTLADSFRAGEGTVLWTASSILPAGSEVTIYGNNTASTGNVTITGPFGLYLSPNGDQIFAYQGPEPMGSNQSGFLAAIHVDGPWTTNSTNGSNSLKPAVFTDGLNSVNPQPEYNEYAYDCSLSTGTVINLQSAVNNAANWQGTDNPALFTPANCGFSIQSSANLPGTQIAGLGSGATFPLGTTVETWIATDAFGNSDTCSFTVTVVDGQAPDITCPAPITVSNDPGQCGAIVSYSNATATDLCSPVNISQTAGPASGTLFAVGVDSVVFTATDTSGNSSTCILLVTVQDQEAPSITCPADTTIPNDPGLCSALFSYALPAATDNCSGVQVSLSNGLGSGSAFPGGVNIETYLAQDAAGNTDSCSFSITVIDVQPPVLSCPNDTLVFVPDTTGQVTVNYPLPTAVENCPSGSYTQTLGLGDLIFTGYRSDNIDFISFVLLKNVAQGTEIDFTDRGWTNTDQFRAGEGSIRWTSPADLPAGTEVTIYGNNTASIGTVTVTGPWGLYLSPTGDQVFAWQGPEPSGSNQSSFIAAIHVDGAWTTNSTNGSNSMKPAVFTDGVNSLSFPTEYDNMRYDCSVTGPDIPTASAAIMNTSNWIGSDDPTGFTPPSCGFSFPPPPAVNLSLLSGLGTGASFPVGTHTEVWIGTDDSGLMDTCSFVVTVVDTNPGPPNALQEEIPEDENLEQEESTNLPGGNAALGRATTKLKVYPNPFREEVTFQVELPEEADLQLQISDLSGKVIRSFRSEGKVYGVQKLIWDGKDDAGNGITSGVYIYRLRIGQQTEFGRIEYIR